MELIWHRKNWHPWGTTIGYHDWTHVKAHGRLCRIERFNGGEIAPGEEFPYVVSGYYADSARRATERDAVALALVFLELCQDGEYHDIREIQA